MKKKTGDYDQEVELSKGADLTASSYDKTQGVSVEEGKVTVGGKAGVAVITGLASGNPGGGIDGTLSLWLSIFRFKRPDGTVNHVAGWNIMLALQAGQSALDTAKAFAAYINGGTRPYKAKTSGTKIAAKIAITYTEK